MFSILFWGLKASDNLSPDNFTTVQQFKIDDNLYPR